MDHHSQGKRCIRAISVCTIPHEKSEAHGWKKLCRHKPSMISGTLN